MLLLQLSDQIAKERHAREEMDQVRQELYEEEQEEKERRREKVSQGHLQMSLSKSDNFTFRCNLVFFAETIGVVVFVLCELTSRMFTWTFCTADYY